MNLTVANIRDEADGIRSFRLVDPDGAALPPYEPGAHIDVTAPGGVTRQYSLCGSPDDDSAYLIAVKREPASRGGSASLHADVSEGDQLAVGAPRNLFALDPAAPEHLLFGAGIGITPLLSMAYRLQRSGSRYTLHYFARSPDTAAFADLLASDRFAGNVRFHYGVAPDALDRALRACLAQAACGGAAHVYTCGPAPFMQRVLAAAAEGRADDAIHLEHFAAEPVAAPAGGDQSFDVVLAQSGRVLSVPAGMAMVDVLAQAGIVIDTSCREGICGTCVVPVLEGEPDHRDHCLSRKEKAANDQVCACVSRSRSARLVLDL
ncbi:MAG: PDR/VanB family oxidoreductase [Burkholderiaceae bacterium]|nr:PDR/VanB family oxidoreductase [Burkholderiaceae bacterium]